MVDSMAVDIIFPINRYISFGDWSRIRLFSWDLYLLTAQLDIIFCWASDIFSLDNLGKLYRWNLVSFGVVWVSLTYNMNRQKQSMTIKLLPLRLHSAASVHIPSNDTKLFRSYPSVTLSRLKLHSATSFVLPSVNISNCFHNAPKVTLSPLKTSVLRSHNVISSNIRFKKPRLFPTINKCNSKRCRCCNYLSSKSTIKSSVNGRVFNININTDIDWSTNDVIYVLTWNAPLCGMQYVGQTGRALKLRFREHMYNCKTNKRLKNYVYRHFRQSGHDVNNITIQPVEKLIFDKNTTNGFKIKARHIKEFEWIKRLQSPFPLGLNDNIYQEGNISKEPSIDIFSILSIRKRKSRSHGCRKNHNLKRKSRKFMAISDLHYIMADTLCLPP